MLRLLQKFWAWRTAVGCWDSFLGSGFTTKDKVWGRGFGVFSFRVPVVSTYSDLKPPYTLKP